MYPYEARIRVVRLPIKPGKRAAATIRQLAYPSKNAQKGGGSRVRDTPRLARQ
jgi:hypothetical protein